MKQQISAELWDEFETEINKVKDFDVSKLNLSPECNRVLDDFFKKFLDPKENFPEGARHNVLEKNFAIYICKNKIEIKQIKEAYAFKGFDIKSLLSQIKGVQGGTYGQEPNVSVGELVNWCKQFRPDLVDCFKDINKIIECDVIRRQDLIFPTQHLKNFNELASILQIVGDEYKHLKKCFWYHNISGQIPEHLLIVRNGQMEVDLRDHLFIVLPTGANKGNIKNRQIKIKRDLGKKAIPLTSYHEEQLIGRVIKRQKEGTKKKNDYEWIKNYGHFIADEILIDECKSLLCDRDKETARKFFLIATDKYQQNEVYKRLNENLDNDEETLKYFPKFNSILGTQPFKFFENNLVLNGFLKRVTTDYIPPFDRPDDYFDKKIEDKNPLSNNYNKTIEYLRDLNNLKYFEWTFDNDVDETFKQCYKMLRYAGLYNSRKKRNYTRLVEWSLQDRLLKKCCLLAFGNGRINITSKDVEIAFIDCLEDFVIELDYVNDKIFGELDYGSVWGAVNQTDLELLKWLFKKGAVSEEKSQVTISDFQEQISDETSLSKASARKKYYKLIEQGSINAKQIGRHDSKVWLTNIPKGAQGAQGDKGISKSFYFSLLEKYKEILGLRHVSPLSPLSPLKLNAGIENNGNTD